MVAGLLASGCSGDCIKGRSAVHLTLPGGWTLSEFCLEEERVLEDGRHPIAGPGGETYYAIDASDRPREYSYRVEAIADDGRRLEYEGEIKTVGLTGGGDDCRPSTAAAGMIITPDGRVKEHP